ncbi:MAG: hypothetical protein Alpg2KO_11730 [Alphaproteobacteria bacterium]
MIRQLALGLCLSLGIIASAAAQGPDRQQLIDALPDSVKKQVYSSVTGDQNATTGTVDRWFSSLDKDDFQTYATRAQRRARASGLSVGSGTDPEQAAQQQVDTQVDRQVDRQTDRARQRAQDQIRNRAPAPRSGGGGAPPFGGPPSR